MICAYVCECKIEGQKKHCGFGWYVLPNVHLWTRNNSWSVCGHPCLGSDAVVDPGLNTLEDMHSSCKAHSERRQRECVRGRPACAWCQLETERGAHHILPVCVCPPTQQAVRSPLIEAQWTWEMFLLTMTARILASLPFFFHTHGPFKSTKDT